MVDLAAAARQIQLDILARDVSVVLTKHDIPHVLLKGPSTARWLYDPPRFYRDVDMLVPRSRLKEAKRAIEASGLANASAGKLGEEAPHSLLMVTPSGAELDLHVVLPMMNPHRQRGDALWRALEQHVDRMDLEGDRVPILDAIGRCLTIAMHALESADESEQSREDLRRARRVAPPDIWRQTETLAQELAIADALAAAFAIGVDALPTGGTVESRLKATHAVGGAFALQRVASAPWRARPGLLLREAFPSVGFMRQSFPERSATATGLLAVYIRRWLGLAVQLPTAVRQLRAARRPTRNS